VVTSAELAELYEVARDAEADTLDSLRRRAGQTWEHIRCWTNAADNTRCENCGRPRDELEAAGEVATD
jgi:hypothetical protein